MKQPKFTPDEDLKIKELYLSGETAQQIADVFGTYKQPVLFSLKRSGVPRRKKWKRASGDKNGHWNGGIRFIKGYKHILLPLHHLARKDGYVPEHRLIMEISLGREISPTEVVNHIDGDILNNDPLNLSLFLNNGEHIKNHVSGFKRGSLGKFTNQKNKVNH